MLTRWKQPCVIWEASKLTHLVRLAEPVSRPSRCQNCGGIVRSPHALGRLWRNNRENASYLCVRAIIGRKRSLKMHEVAVETFQMRAAVNKNDLPANVLRLGEIHDSVRHSRW